MGHKTDIEWADATWNPTRGCSRHSEGCRNCYAETLAGRFSKPGQPYEGVAKMTKAGARWTGKIKFFEHLLLRPTIWQQPLTIFVDSMSDLFHEGVPLDVIDQVMAVMAIAERHTFIVLTRRVARMQAYFSDPAMPARVRHWILTPPEGSALHGFTDGAACLRAAIRVEAGPLSNLWLGASVEDQPTANERIPQILATPAAIRLISYEPAIGAVDFTRIERPPNEFDKKMPGFDSVTKFTLNAMSGFSAIEYPGSHGQIVAAEMSGAEMPRLDWIICGGESGAGARPMHPDWARTVRDQCIATKVPFFFKQWGAHLPVGQVLPGFGRIHGATAVKPGRMKLHYSGTPKQAPEHAFAERGVEFTSTADGRLTFRVGKKAAGHLLDGATWQQMPPVPHRVPA